MEIPLKPLSRFRGPLLSAVVAGLAREHRWIRSIELMRNYGQHNALLCGIRSARYDVIVTMDDDLQYAPEEIQVLLRALTADHDVVYGCPRHQRHGVGRRLASWWAKVVLHRLLGLETARIVSAFRAFRTELRQAFAGFDGPTVNVDVLLTWATSRFAAVPVRHAPRLTGKSAYSTLALFKHTLNVVTGFTVVPLRVAGLVGSLLTVVALVTLGALLGRYLVLGTNPQGLTIVAAFVTLLFGAQFLAVGVMGEYLARVFLRTTGQAPYVVRPPTSHASDIDVFTMPRAFDNDPANPLR